jgi:putative sigma-54 modulation protein
MLQMKIAVRGENTEITDSLRDYAEKKLSKLNRYFEQINEVQVTAVTYRGSYIVEVTIPLNSFILRAEESSDENLYAAVDLVVEKLEKQIQKHRTRLYRRFRNQGLKNLITTMGDESTVGIPSVVRTKRFAVKPMQVDEAILQMSLLGHDFYVFSNSETEQVNVLYRRKDGNFGLIEPEF